MTITTFATATLAGCNLTRFGLPSPTAPTFETLETWSAFPLPPSPELAAKYHERIGGCNLGIDGGTPLLLVQDRRTEWTAGFLVSDPSIFGVCLISTLADTSGGSSNALTPMSAPLSIDYQNVHELDNFVIARVQAGRAPDAVRVVIELGNGESLTASLANGFWLGWWPQNAVATRVVAFDETGAEAASLAVEP